MANRLAQLMRRGQSIWLEDSEHALLALSERRRSIARGRRSIDRTSGVVLDMLAATALKQRRFATRLSGEVSDGL